MAVEVTVCGEFLNLRPEGYDNPMSLDYYNGRLRALVNHDAEVAEPLIFDLEGARSV